MCSAPIFSALVSFDNFVWVYSMTDNYLRILALSRRANKTELQVLELQKELAQEREKMCTRPEKAKYDDKKYYRTEYTERSALHGRKAVAFLVPPKKLVNPYLKVHSEPRLAMPSEPPRGKKKQDSVNKICITKKRCLRNVCRSAPGEDSHRHRSHLGGRNEWGISEPRSCVNGPKEQQNRRKRLPHAYCYCWWCRHGLAAGGRGRLHQRSFLLQN